MFYVGTLYDDLEQVGLIRLSDILSSFAIIRVGMLYDSPGLPANLLFN